MPLKPKTNYQDIKKMMNVRYAVSNADPFYSSTPWQRLRKVKLQQSALCEDCLLQNRYEPAVHVHHVVPRDVDRSKELMMNNLKSLCHSCHSRIHGDRVPERRA